MTWSIKPPALRNGNPIVCWDGKPLKQLSRADFDAATRAAEALGEDIVDSAAAGSRDPHVLMADQAADIVAGIMREMTRRDVDGIDKEPDGDVSGRQLSDGDAA